MTIGQMQPATFRAEIARRSFAHFIRYVQPSFLFNWHHLQVIDALERLVRREFTQLVVMMPPRHSKSELVSRLFPAWRYACNQDEKVICASYALELSSSMGRDCQKIIMSDAYRALFPEARLAERSDSSGAIRTNKRFDIVGNDGYYIASGIGGALTGMGCTVGIIDDPIKNAAEADSETYRDNAEAWYNTTFKTRFEPDAVEVICQTRWHEDDLTGRILKKHNPNRLTISLPAIAEQVEPHRKIGEALWETRYSRTNLLEKQGDIGSRAWNALYQQRPAPQEGNIIKRDWFQWYDPRTYKFEGKRVNFYFDTAYTDKEKNDPTGGIAYVKEGMDFYVLEFQSLHLEFLESMTFVVTFTARNGYSFRSIIRVEPKATGKSLVQVAKKQTGLNIIEGQPPTESKVSRANQCLGVIEGKHVFLPLGMAWTGNFLDVVAAFPNAVHDEEVDCLTGMILSESKGAFSLSYS